MKMTHRQQQLYNYGQQARKTLNDLNIFDDISFTDAIRYLCNNDIMMDIVTLLSDDGDNLFFKAGLMGITPQHKIAYRYGAIPKSGYSTNWGTGEQENGVSCFFKDKENLYTHIYGLQDLKKIKIVGWYLGEHGTDGEPLLLHAKEI